MSFIQKTVKKEAETSLFSTGQSNETAQALDIDIIDSTSLIGKMDAEIKKKSQNSSIAKMMVGLYSSSSAKDEVSTERAPCGCFGK